MGDNNTSRRVASIVHLDLLDPLLEAMLDGGLVPGSGGNVSVEFNFIPFLVDESEMDHQWHPGPMDVEYGDDDNEDKDEEEEHYEDGEGEEEEGEEEEEEEEERYRHSHHRHHHHDYSSQREYEEDEDEEEENEANEAEYDYDVGDEDVDEEDVEEDEDDDDEDEDEDDTHLRMGFIDDSVLANYGSLGWSICHNISDRKILNDTFNSRDFLRQMVEFFFTNLKQSTTSSTSSLQKLLNCLPSLSDLRNLILKTKYTMKEAIIIKVVLEMYESYHKTYGAPNFKVYHTEVIPLLLDFYNRLPDAALKLIAKQLTRVLLNLSNLMNNFKLFHTKQEYIAHYRESTRRMRNLSEGTDPALFMR